jgi:hypothetical protein
MMTRDEIRELAAFKADETKGHAPSVFTFNPILRRIFRIAARQLSLKTL